MTRSKRILLSVLIALTLSATAAAADKETVNLTVGSWDDVLARVRQHPGQVVLLDIWTTTCLACTEELPKVVQLAKDFGGEQVVLITVNCDYDGIEGKPPEFYRKQVVKFLRESHATGGNVENVM
ncbi:MAG: hypothetical protein ACREJB_01180, partial [Planctomycetaceae bacterium]